MKILIELPTWLGDCVMATPAIESIIDLYPDADITFLGSPVATEAMSCHPRVTDILILKRSYRSLYQTAKSLVFFDLFLSFRSSKRSSIFKIFVPARYKYQFNKCKYREGHQVEKYMLFVNNSLNSNFQPKLLTLYTKKEKLYGGRPKIGINPGASYGSAKRWYPEEFAKVAWQLSERYDIVIFGGPGEQDIANDIETSLIRYGVKNYQNLAGKTTISELINYISELSLFVTGDSGPMHVAAAFQVPTVSIFGPTRDKETSQWMNANSAIVKKSLECQPCMKRACPLKHHNCMKLIKANDVLAVIKKLD